MRPQGAGELQDRLCLEDAAPRGCALPVDEDLAGHALEAEVVEVPDQIAQGFLGRLGRDGRLVRAILFEPEVLAVAAHHGADALVPDADREDRVDDAQRERVVVVLATEHRALEGQQGHRAPGDLDAVVSHAPP